MSIRSLRFGTDVLLSSPATWSTWSRVGLVTNDAARLAGDSTVHTRRALQSVGMPLVRLFGPEHGLGATAADGANVADGVDTVTGVPVVSLYGDRMRPDVAHLADLDVVLFDIPDIGARFYTYAWTLWHVLHACADAGVPLVVLDRPNPLGGVLSSAEGPVLEPACFSFIGEDDIPIRHSLTLGELARLWQREHCPGVSLHVVTIDGWDLTAAWPATSLPWVPTSPAMPSFDSALWYPATCFFEATNVSVGRGTALPFAMIGAPWLQAEQLIEVCAEPSREHAVRMVPVQFTPMQGPHTGQSCRGVRLAAMDLTPRATNNWVAREWRPVSFGLSLLHAVATIHPTRFALAPYPTAANPLGENHLARLVGRRSVAEQLLTLDPAQRASRVSAWTRDGEWFHRVAPIVLYERGR